MAQSTTGGAFAVLTDVDGDDGGWEEVHKKGKKAAETSEKQTANAAASGSKSTGRAMVEATKFTSAAEARAAAFGTGASGSKGGVHKPVSSNGLACTAVVSIPAPAASPAPPKQQVAVQPKLQTHNHLGKPVKDDYYKAFQRCFVNSKGEVCLRFHKTDIVKIRPNGDVVLTTGGYFTYTTLCSMNDALCHINMRVKYVGEIAEGDWFVVDGYGTHKYEDNMMIPARTAVDKSRGQVLLQAMNQGAPDETKQASKQQQPPQQQPQQPPAQGPGSTQHELLAPAPASNLQTAVVAPHATAGQSQPPLPPAAAAATRSAAPWAAAAAGAGMSLAQRLKHSNYQAMYAQQQQQAAAAATASRQPAQQEAAAPHATPTPVLTTDHYQSLLGETQHLDLVDDEHACVVCMEQLRDTILVPCGHVVMCSACANNVVAAGKECPMCRQQIALTVALQVD